MRGDSELDVLIVGHVTKDVIRIPGRPDREMAGGTVHYVSRALRGLGRRVAVLTKLARGDEALVEEMRASGVEVIALPSAKTTVFENIYTDPSLGERIQRVRSIADPFRPEDLDAIRAKAIHFGPLTGDDMSAEVVRAARAHAELVAIDPQGMLRRVENGKIALAPRASVRDAIAAADVVKTDDREAAMIVGTGDFEEASARLLALGAREALVTQAHDGSYVRWPSGAARIAAIAPREAVDATGCGDTYVAGYLHRRLEGHGPEASAWFAAATASLKLESYGPFAGSEREVEERLARGKRLWGAPARKLSA